MKAIQEKTKFFLISIFTIAGLLFSSANTIAKGDVLYEKNYSVNSNESLAIKVSGADIEIAGWDNSEVHIIVVGSESINDYFDFNFSYEDGMVKVITKKKYDWNSWSSSKDYRIKVKVPYDFSVNTKTSGGDIEIKRINGELEFYTSGGDVEIKNSKGSLVAKTSGGDIEINEFEGSTTLKTSGGDIEAKNIRGSVEAKTSGGDIELSVSDGMVTAGTSGGDVSLKYKGHNEGVELYTSGGSISVKLPSEFKADVSLKTSGGSIHNQFDISRARDITKSKFIGKYNGGGANFSAKTSGGSIYVK